MQVTGLQMGVPDCSTHATGNLISVHAEQPYEVTHKYLPVQVRRLYLRD